MNDEACTYYSSIIEQMTIGHQFLYNEFGVRPRIAWHIDPFGHSSTQASLFASMGFDAFLFGRVDYQDKSRRLAEQEMETVWRPSPSLGKANEIFSVVLHNGYNPPDGFCFDGEQCNDGPIQADPELSDYDLDEYVAKFIDAAREQSSSYNDSNIMMTMGSDFQYENAEIWFSNLDILIRYFEKHPEHRLNVLYSTPSIYVAAKHALNRTWTVKTDDFFPYADNQHAFWTGYFTSRAGFKQYERVSAVNLKTCRMFELASGDSVLTGMESPAFNLWRALSVAQHHDAISGTAKQRVNDDYTLRLAIGNDLCDSFANQVLSQGSSSVFEQCWYANLSMCSTTEAFQDSLTIVTSNPTLKYRNEHIKFPVIGTGYSLFSADGTELPIHFAPIGPDIKAAREGVKYPSKATFDIVFRASLDPLGFNEFTLKRTAEVHSLNATVISSDFTLENEFTRVQFVDGQLSRISNKVLDMHLNISQSWEHYASSEGTAFDSQASGAYIFRPVNSSTTKHRSEKLLTLTRGQLFDEVVQTFDNGKISQHYRLYHDHPHVELEYIVLPLDLSSGVGKELVSRFSTNIASESTFFTDANGREVLQRIRGHRDTWDLNLFEPVAGNYYPVNTRIFIQDSMADSQFTVLTDRSQGGSSMRSGEIEIMVNRRTTRDDGRGVGEPISEDLTVRGKHYLYFDSIERSTRFHREFSERVQNLPTVFFSESSHDFKVPSIHRTSTLPQNLNLVSIQKLTAETSMIRISHIYAVSEHAVYSNPVTINLADYFEFNKVQEVTLTGNSLHSEVSRLSWNTVDGVVESQKHRVREKLEAIVTFHPMEIKAFVLAN